MLNVAQTRQKGRRLLAHFAPLWVISAERPRTALRVLGASPMRGWPAGFHRVPGPLPVQLVIVPDLPPGEETHWLRLLGTGETLYQALAELGNVRHDRPGARALQTLVLSYRQDLELKRGKLSKAEKEFLMRKTAAERIEEFERQTREAGKRDVLSRQLSRRFGPLSPRMQRRLASASSAELDEWVERVLTAESVEEVFADS
jgi:hypothetical protein